MTGRIIKSNNGLFDIKVERSNNGSDIGKVFVCSPRGIFRRAESEIKKILTGDMVILNVDENEKDPDKDAAVITEILQRKNSLLRPPIANIDVLFIVTSPAMPAPDYFHIDKITSIAFHNKIKPVIVINKMDIGDGGGIYGIYANAGFDIIKTSASNGIEDKKIFYNFIENNVCAFCGASGVGKTSIINVLFPELKMETGDISRKTERGKHTTKSVYLYSYGSGYVADTPGFNILDFDKFDYYDKEDLLPAFPDMEKYSCECKFSKCSHTKEEGCSVLAAVGSGAAEKSRHESYAALYAQLNKKNKWDKKQI